MTAALVAAVGRFGDGHGAMLSMLVPVWTPQVAVTSGGLRVGLGGTF